jgi:hypothetical protein
MTRIAIASPPASTWLYFFPAFGTKSLVPLQRAVVYEQLMNRWLALSLASLGVGAAVNLLLLWH